MSSIKLITIIASAMFLLIEALYLRFVGLYLMCGTLFIMPFVSYAIVRVVARGLRYTRECPGYVREGDSFSSTVRISGQSGVLGPIEVEDSLPEWIDRVSEEAVFLSDRSAVSYLLQACKRGEYTLGPVHLRVSDPLGFFAFRVGDQGKSSVVVLPSPLEVPSLEILPSAVMSEFAMGMAGRRSVKGSGLDFHGVREYQPGDELRRVHWTSTARHGRLNVIEFEHTPFPDIVIAIDRKKGSEIGSGRYTSLEYAVKIAAGIAERTTAEGGSVRLVGMGSREQGYMSSAGTQRLYEIWETLARVQADSNETLTEVLLKEIDGIYGGTVVVCLVSGLDDELARCIRLLDSRGIGVRIILTALPGDHRNYIEEISSFLTGATALSIVECSNTAMECRVRYEYTT